MKNKGHTLLEIMIVIAILGILLTVLLNIFIPGVRIFKMGKDRAEVQADAMIALRRIKMELSCTSIKSVTINSDSLYNVSGDPFAISFLSPYKDVGTTKVIALDPATSTLPIWQKYVIYYFDTGSGLLKRKEKSLPVQTALTTALTNTELYNYCTDSNITPSTVSRNIKVTSISMTSPYTIRIDITTAKTGAGPGGKQEQTMKNFIEIFPHNTY